MIAYNAPWCNAPIVHLDRWRMLVGLDRQPRHAERSYPMAIPVSWSQDVVKDTLQVIMPDPMAELLESVETACVPESEAEALPTVDATAQDLTAYVEAVRQNAQISPGCRAELLSVAEALQSH